MLNKKTHREAALIIQQFHPFKGKEKAALGSVVGKFATVDTKRGTGSLRVEINKMGSADVGKGGGGG